MTNNTITPITLYAASIPVFKQMLLSMSDVLTKAEAHAANKKIDARVFLESRLSPDMLPLLRQVQIATDFARGTAARLAGIDVPVVDNTESSFAELQTLIASTLTFLASVSADKINGQEDRAIVLRPGTPKERHLNGQAYLLSYSLPQFFFHVTTTYALLRHNGVEIGKKDYMGAY
jgi:uncharacterized protein